MTNQKDRVFSDPQSGGEAFRFGPRVAACFDDMAERSIPLYRELQIAAVTLAQRAAQPETAIYDIGCSTGTTLVPLALATPFESTAIVGTDSSEHMLKRCREKLEMAGVAGRVRLLHSELEKTPLESASAVLMNYTLQFSKPESRAETIKRVHDALVPGGVLILAEKLRFDDPRTAELMENLYYDFKRRNGYSETEIEQKRKALEGVLVPFTREENIALLTGAGFQRIVPILQAYPFAAFAAFRS